MTGNAVLWGLAALGFCLSGAALYYGRKWAALAEKTESQSGIELLRKATRLNQLLAGAGFLATILFCALVAERYRERPLTKEEVEIEVATQAIRGDQEDPALWEIRARLYRSHGNPAKADADYVRAAALLRRRHQEGDDPMPLLVCLEAQASNREHAKNWKGAEELLDEAIHVTTNELFRTGKLESLLLFRARVLEGQQKYDLALADMKTAAINMAKRKNIESTAYEHLARFYARRGKDQAASHWDKVANDIVNRRISFEEVLKLLENDQDP